MTKSHHAVLLPALLLQHDDAVGALVEGGGQALPLRVQRLDPPLQVELALSHYCDLVPDGTIISWGKGKKVQVSPESLEMGDVLSHACLLVVHLDDDDDDDNDEDGDDNADGDDNDFLVFFSGSPGPSSTAAHT